MPANFTEEEKKLIQEKLYVKGYELLEKYGMKKMKISELAKSCDIATGTFYNFFPSKKGFVLKLIEKRKQKSFENFNNLVQKYPNGIPFEETYRFFLDNLLEDNVYRLLSQEEYNSLLEEKPKGNMDEIAAYMMSKLDTSKGVSEFMLFAECYKVIVIGSSDLSKLNEKYLEKVLAVMVKSACQTLY